MLLAECGAEATPLARLSRRLRSADPDERPESARLAFVSIAGIESGGRAAETEVLEPATAEATAPPVELDPDPEPEPTGPAPTGQPPAEPPHRTYGTGSTGRPAPRALAAGLVALAAVAVVLLVALGGDGGSGGEQSASTGADKQSGKSHDPGRSTRRPAATPRSSRGARRRGPGGARPDDRRHDAGPGPGPGANARRCDGSALNDQGYALLQQGNAATAVPILRRAVDSLDQSDGLTYAYALYNLGSALRQSGHPEEAIPILEQRLKYPDQRSTVRAELAKAKAQAGD